MKRYDLNLLYALDALAKTGSVKGAAQMMNLSAPAMSHTLARLRETTGDPLLVRAGRKLVPTQRALSMIEVTRELVERAQTVLAPALDDESWMMANRNFVVVAPDELAIANGIRLLDAIRSRMPNARLTLLPASDHTLDELRQGHVDVEIRSSGTLPPEIKLEVLFDQQVVVAMSRSNEISDKEMTLLRYIEAKHVCLSNANELDDKIERALSKAGGSRIPILRVATPYASLAAVSQSDLIATAQRSLVESVSAFLGLAIKIFPLEIEILRIIQIWHPRTNLDTQHTWLRTCVKSIFGKANAVGLNS